ncbi:hypothetical protein TSO5_26130 [Azospirillum sp. TSO5]|nr:hypothetical protein TSO5_26130 [Azospirillum sp. TSO5]GLR77503.1 hypothetical protein GCM10007856_01710 [Azospirillum oryzae]
MSRVTVAQMAAHIAHLCETHEIVIEGHSRGGRAFRKERRVKIRPVKSAATYAVALHEVGHILGPWQSQTRLCSEAGAWMWAKEHALLWTPVMEQKLRACLASYMHWATRRSNHVSMPEPEHPFWALLGQPAPEASS